MCGGGGYKKGTEGKGEKMYAGRNLKKQTGVKREHV